MTPASAIKRAAGGAGGHCGYSALSGATSAGLEGLQRGRVAAQRLGHRDVVEVHEPDPRVLGLAGRAGQVVVAQDVDVLRRRPPCRSARARGSGRPRSRRSPGPSSPDLVDERRDLLRRRVLEVGDLDRADDVPAVVAAEVGVGVVVGQQLALGARDRRERRAHRLVELVDLGLELVVVGAEVVRRRPGSRAERSSRTICAYFSAYFGSVQRCGLGLPPDFGNEKSYAYSLSGIDLRAELDDLGAVLHVRLGELLRRLLELQAVDVQHVDRRQQLGDARLGLERVRVRALRDDARDLHAVAADVRDDARDRRDGRADRQLPVVGGVAAAARRERCERDGEQGCVASAEAHAVASLLLSRLARISADLGSTAQYTGTSAVGCSPSCGWRRA